MANPNSVRVRLCECCYFGRAGTIVVVPKEYAEALIADNKATPAPLAENKSLSYRSTTIFKGGLDGG